MKTSNFIMVIFVSIILFPSIIQAQDIDVQYMIGKSKSEVIKNYGKPVHQDNSNPEMICMFYQGEGYNMVFVGNNKEGIYQAESRISYTSERSAKKALDELIGSSIKNKFKIDTVSVNAFKVQKTGVKADIQLYKNEITKKYEVSVKAGR